MENEVFKGILREATASGLKFTLSCHQAASDRHRENWRVKEDEELDAGLGLSLDKKYSLSELKAVIKALPKRIVKYRDSIEVKEGSRIVKTTAGTPTIRDGYWGTYVIVRIEIGDKYNDGCYCGDYLEFYVTPDMESLALCLGGENEY